MLAGIAPHVLIAADVVYEPSLVAPLLQTIIALLKLRHNATALIAAERRGVAWNVFLESIQRAGLLHTDRGEEVRASLQSASCPFWCSPSSIARMTLLEIGPIIG